VLRVIDNDIHSCERILWLTPLVSYTVVANKSSLFFVGGCDLDGRVQRRVEIFNVFNLNDRKDDPELEKARAKPAACVPY